MPSLQKNKKKTHLGGLKDPSTTNVEVFPITCTPHCIYPLSVNLRISIINSAHKMSLDYYPRKEEGGSKWKHFYPKWWLFSLLLNQAGKLFSHSQHLQIQSTEARIDKAYQIRPTVSESRIHSDNKTAAKGPRGGKQTIQILFSAKSSYSIKHLLRASTSFLRSQQFDCRTF